MNGKVEIRWGRLTYREAVCRAISVRNEEYAHSYGTAKTFSPTAFLHRITVNQLRHRYTNYDRLVKGCHGSHPEREAVWRAVMERMAADFPELRAEIRRQTEERFRAAVPV